MLKAEFSVLRSIYAMNNQKCIKFGINNTRDKIIAIFYHLYNKNREYKRNLNKYKHL